jgi:glyceraldehyde 3-phosphate dehydrogenase
MGTSSKLRIGINGYGRIGRAIHRIVASSGVDWAQVVAVNDRISDTNNLRYLLKFDSVYGRFELPVDNVSYFSSSSIDGVDWERAGVDVIVESSGAHANVIAGRRLKGVRRVYVTQCCREGTDRTVILGVNDDQVRSEDFVLSSSICDANAVGPILHCLNECFGVTSSFVTTLHPWLNYQNLLDGGVPSQDNPAMVWKDYSIGRASTMSLIPKPTTLVPALSQSLSWVRDRVSAISYRTPMASVASADITVQLGSRVSAQTLARTLRELSDASVLQQEQRIAWNDEDTVSIDFVRTSSQCAIDARWLHVVGDLAKVVLWYDNEWGYASTVVKLLKKVESRA